MSKDQLLKWKSHYEFMLDSMELDVRHERIVRERLAVTLELLGRKVA